jgi:SAM-dependent methyltransferase
MRAKECKKNNIFPTPQIKMHCVSLNKLGGAMTLRQAARSIALQIPFVRRVVSNRDELLRERDRLRQALSAAEDKTKTAILDVYVTDPPTREVAFRLFDGAWSSNVPGFGLGHAELFDDPRIKWVLQQCGGVQGKRVLELGPLEGGHTWMIAKAGASNITSIESNTTAFLKCLIVQSTLKFDADFLLGDFRPYLEKSADTYDLLLASGVLYHMTEPAKLLQDMAKASRSIAIWTHYYDSDVICSRNDLRKKFDDTPRIEEIGSRKVISFKQNYLEALKWKGFCGGSAPTSYWLTRESLIGVLTDLGLNVTIGEEQKDHPNGPAILLFASRP